MDEITLTTQDTAALGSTYFGSGWRVRTLADSYKPRPPLQYIVEDLLVLPSLNLIYGPPGIFKSLLLNDLCLCVATGSEWLPSLTTHQHTQRKTLQSGVLWLDFDSGERRTDERFEALAHARHADEDTPLFYLSMPDPWLDASNPKHINNLIDTINLMSIQLVVIDNLGLVKGDIDENSSEMAFVMGGFRRLAERTGAAINVIHHQRKGSVLNAGTRSGESIRGNSAIEASLDLALSIEQADKNDRSRVICQSTKSRDYEVMPFGAKFDYRHHKGTRELAWAMFKGFEVQTNAGTLAAREAIIRFLSTNGASTQNTIVDQLSNKDLSQSKLRAILDAMEADGSLNVTKGARNSKLYSIAINVPSAADARLNAIRSILTNAPIGDLI